LRSGFELPHLAEPRDDDVHWYEAFLKILARQRALNFTPGTEFQYNNSGFTLLAIIVKRVSGQSLRAFADSNIFKPLGMTHTHFHDDPTMIVPHRASGYYLDAGGLHVAIDAWNRNSGIVGNMAIVGNTGLFTTARDLLLWEQNFADAHVGGAELVTAMQTPAVLRFGTNFYGFGLNIGLYRGLRRIWHGGGDPGYGANVARYPDQGLAIAVLCNQESGAPSEGVADIYLEDAFPSAVSINATAAPPTVSLSAEQLASKVGLYRDSTNESLRRIVLRDGKLRAFGLAIGDGAELTPVSENRFLLPWGTAVEFAPAVAGRAQELRELPDGRKHLVFQQENAFAPSSAELRAFAGEYVSPELEVTYTLAARDSGLVIQIRGRADIVLRPIFADAFEGSREGDSVGVVKFSRDARGVVTGFTLNTGGVRGLRFDRVKR
jgi:hypothetical protein